MEEYVFPEEERRAYVTRKLVEAKLDGLAMYQAPGTAAVLTPKGWDLLEILLCLATVQGVENEVDPDEAEEIQESLQVSLDYVMGVCIPHRAVEAVEAFLATQAEPPA